MSIFDYHHNNPPSPFNPDFIPWASDVMTMAVHRCYLDGVYKLPQSERPKLIREKYDSLMLLGKPSIYDVRASKDYIYNL